MRERGETAMIKLLGPNNDLRTEDGVITKWGYLVAIASTVFGLCCFLIGRKRHKKEPR
jgi:hypothetical protein